jgi:lipopolysaccharide transport system ATP-binding protein
MSGNVVIRIENVSKKYTVDHEIAPVGLRHVLQDLALQPARLLRNRVTRWQERKAGNGQASRSPAIERHEEFWALRNVSIEIAQGEVLGIIGRNGAGKSTLLKILSRITDPSTGRIGVKGRVASLLEVGTGFHPDLTGRENIWLNGAILGMTRREIAKQFDEIVDFAGVEKFIDTPVKRYSTGMYVRLGFAVAAHLNPEILLIDEILSVGDGDFQKKCLGKMQEVAASAGRTILFVSHQLPSVVALCSRACLLQNGQLEADGDAKSVVEVYQKGISGLENSQRDGASKNRPGRGTMRISSIRPEKQVFDPAEEKRFFVRIVTNDLSETTCYLYMIFVDAQNHELFVLDSRHVNTAIRPGQPAEVSVVLRTPWMRPGEYSVHAGLVNFDCLDRWDNACRFGVSNELPYSRVISSEAIEWSLVLPDFSTAVSHVSVDQLS